jgi:hypothetical protein
VSSTTGIPAITQTVSSNQVSRSWGRMLVMTSATITTTSNAGGSAVRAVLIRHPPIVARRCPRWEE